MADDISSGAVSTVVKGFADLGPGGLFSILLFIFLVAVCKYFVGQMKTQKSDFDIRLAKVEDHLAKEREAHDKTRQTLMTEQEENAAVNAVFRQQMATQQVTFDTLVKALAKT